MSTAPFTSDSAKNGGGADFETAMKACGYGVFNVLLLLIATPGIFSGLMDVATMSYVLPAAECDLQLTVYSKGYIHAMPLAAFLVSAVPWGFVADTYGRKKVLIFGLLLNSVLTFFTPVVKNADELMVFKFFGGILSAGPAAVFVSYVSEFHGKMHRLYVLIALGMICSVPLILLPTIAFYLLPKKIEFDVGNLKYNSWRVFITITSFPALISGVLLIFFPESPKFLMSQARNEEALKAFQKVYKLNNLKSKEPYSIQDLYNENTEKAARRATWMALEHKSFSERMKNFGVDMKEGYMQIRPLWSKNYIFEALKVYMQYFCLLLSINAIGLWIPQYFATVREMAYDGETHLETCSVIKYSMKKSKNIELFSENGNQQCKVHIEPDSYLNNIIVGSCIGLIYFFTQLVVKFIDNHIIMRIYFVLVSICLITLYWSTSQTMSLVLFCIFLSTGLVSTTLVITAAVNVFPTTMRTMAVITILSCGRCGAMIGNFVLPHLMRTHCIAVFAFYGVSIFCSFVISFFIPNSTKQNLK